MIYSSLIRRIILDLAKNPIPRQFRKYHAGGKYRGERGAPFDDIREVKSTPHPVESDTNLEILSPDCERVSNERERRLKVISQIDPKKLQEEIFTWKINMVGEPGEDYTKEEIEKMSPVDCYYDSGEIKYGTMAVTNFIAKQIGIGGKPAEQISPDKYDEIVKNPRKDCRYFARVDEHKYNAGNMEGSTDYLRLGNYGSAIYTYDIATSKDIDIQNPNEKIGIFASAGNTHGLLEGFIGPDSNVASSDVLEPETKKYEALLEKHLRGKVPDDLIEISKIDIGLGGMLLGFDAIVDPNVGYLMIMNRSKMHVKNNPRNAISDEFKHIQDPKLRALFNSINSKTPARQRGIPSRMRTM